MFAVALVLAGASAVGTSAAWAASPGDVVRVNVAGDGAQANGTSWNWSVSENGRFVAFDSDATNLVPGTSGPDSNGVSDVFLRDALLGTTRLVSASPGGAPGNNRSQGGSASADGQKVAFMSVASNLVPGDDNGYSDIFVRDLVAGTTRMVSVPASGGRSNGGSMDASISGNGRFVAFTSFAGNLVPGGTTGIQVFLRDVVAGTTSLVTATASGAAANGDAGYPAVSRDGRYVAFSSAATNLVPGDDNSRADVFLRDTSVGATVLVSVSSSGVQADRDPMDVAVSGNGRHVTFTSAATNLVPDDTNGTNDAFLRDVVAGTTTMVSVSSSGEHTVYASRAGSVSRDGRFATFYSGGGLVPGAPNGQDEVYIRDLVAGTTSWTYRRASGVDPDGSSYFPQLSADGRYVVFGSNATNLVPQDTNGISDVFLVAWAGDGGNAHKDCTITGTPGNDTLRGTAGNDVICGMGGDDVIYGSTGADTGYGGPGSDTIYGGEHDDRLYGELGGDVIYGGNGKDVLGGGSGKDRLLGQADNDTLWAADGEADAVDGGPGVDGASVDLALDQRIGIELPM